MRCGIQGRPLDHLLGVMEELRLADMGKTNGETQLVLVGWGGNQESGFLHSSFEMSISYSRSEILAGSKIDLCIYLFTYISFTSTLYVSRLLSGEIPVCVCVCGGGGLHDWHLLISCYISLQFPTGIGPSFGPLNAKWCCISGPLGGDLKKS